MTKKEVRKKTRELIQYTSKWMRRDLEKVLSSGCINLNNWESNYLLPKTIMLALHQEQMRNYDGRGTSYERKIKKEAKNIYLHI